MDGIDVEAVTGSDSCSGARIHGVGGAWDPGLDPAERNRSDCSDQTVAWLCESTRAQ